MATAQQVNIAVGIRVRALREAKGWSQEHLAGEAGVHRTYMGDVERGERNPSIGSLVKIANALDVSVSELFRNS